MDSEAAWRIRRVVLSVLFVLLVSVPLYPELYGLDQLTPFTQLAAFRPQGLVLVLVLGVVMLVRRNWRIAGGLVGVLALTGIALTVPRELTRPDPPPAGSRALTVLAVNVLGGGADASEVAKLIRAHRPDLVSLPEAQVEVREEIEAHLADLGYRGYTQQANAAVESATSVLVAASLGEVRLDAETLDAGRVNAGATTRSTVGPVRQTTTQFGHIIVSGGELGRVRLVAYHGFPPLPDDVPLWNRDLEILAKWCAQDGPLVVAGDFNATTDHKAFRDALGKRCRSVASASGRGLSGTWPSDRPAPLRTQIDHVVVSRDIHPGRFRVLRVPGSDHLAVVAKIALPAS